MEELVKRIKRICDRINTDEKYRIGKHERCGYIFIHFDEDSFSFKKETLEQMSDKEIEKMLIEQVF